MTVLHEAGEEYQGPAELLTAQSTIPIEVTLRGYFEPLDGRFHWYGRIAPNATVTDQHRSGSTLVLSTPHGQATGRIADLDPWGRFRISGTGTPPF